MVATSIIAIPIVISKLSIEEINVWFLFAAVVSLSQGVLLGFNSTFVRFIVYSYSGVKIREFQQIKIKKENINPDEFDKNEFSAIYHMMVKVYNILTLFYTSILVLAGYAVLRSPISALSSASEGWIAWIIIAISTTLSFRLGVFQIFLEGIGKVALVQRIKGAVSLVGLVMIITVLLITPTLISIVLVYQIVALAIAFSISFYSYRERRLLVDLNYSYANKRLLRSNIFTSAWKSGITTISANTIQHISSIAVSQLFPPAQSASFLFTKRIFDIMEVFTQTTFQARLPTIAKIRSRGDIKALIPYLRQTQYFAYAVFIAGFIVLITVGNKLLSMMNTNVLLGDQLLIILFSFSIIFRRWLGFSMAISNQSNHLIDFIIIPLTGLSFFILTYALYPLMGVHVFPFAQIFSIILVIPFVAKMYYPVIYTSFFKYEIKTLIPIVGLLILINLLFYLNPIQG
ncbi:MAG: hypothetical protein K9N29_03895 [Candidatus Marinimicrobia bacterium]|nr:hypothetical protein [Candidatus Neomarinimicrobiota bacterium]